MTLQDKVIIITGSSSGIGQATALRFAQEGAAVVVNYRANEAGAQETMAKLEAMGAKRLLVQADVSNPDDVEKLFQVVISTFSRVDILINNAAIGTDRVPYIDASYDDMKEMIDTDLTSVLMCSQKAVRLMQQQGSGKILNTSSIRGWEHGGRAPVYAAAKAAVNSFTRTLAKQVGPAIQVNAVAPGFVKTRSYDNMSEEQLRTFLDQTYLKRWITVEEIADAFIFLAKNDALTGQVLYVDGGFTLK
ncbi:MAG TPA: SDR family oxidoreductase [Candidatus Saccharimonadales bacterium]|nr:SDR family oxidoreductase [Candidatus Saccharimonadales bacterium]